MSETRVAKNDQRRALVDPKIARLAESWNRRAQETPVARDAVRRAFQAALDRARISESKSRRDSTAPDNTRSITTARDPKKQYHRFRPDETHKEEPLSDQSFGDVSARAGTPRTTEPRERPALVSESKRSLISREESRASNSVRSITIDIADSSAKSTHAKRPNSKPRVEDRRLAIPAGVAGFAHFHPATNKQPNAQHIDHSMDGEYTAAGRERAIAASRTINLTPEIVRERRTASRAPNESVDKVVLKHNMIMHMESPPRFEVRVGRAALEPRGSLGRIETTTIARDHPHAPMEHSLASSSSSTTALSHSHRTSTRSDSPSAGLDENPTALWHGELAGIKETLHRLETDFRRANTPGLPSGKRPVYSER